MVISVNAMGDIVCIKITENAWICLDIGCDNKKDKEPAWQLLSKAMRHAARADIEVQCYFDESVSDNQTIEILNTINLDALPGIERMVRKRYWLKKFVNFEPRDITGGVEDGHWESALTPLKAAWAPLVKHINWEQISTRLAT